MMENWWRDLRFGVRMLLNAPGFLAVAVSTLALGIGANTAIFSVINSVLLRPLPYEDAEQLTILTEWSEQVPDMSFSVANMKDLRDQNKVFESLVGYNGTSFILTGEGSEAERLNGRQVTSGMFQSLRKQPVAGRAFTPEDDKPGAEPVVVLGEGFWERRFGRDPGVVGKKLTLSGESFTVIGIAPGTLHGSWKTIDAFTPLLRLEDRIGGDNQRGSHPGIYVIARMKPGVTVEQAKSDVVGIARRLAEQYPNSNAKQSMTVASLHQQFVGDLRPALMVLLGAVAFVLLIACANVANLLLARAATRQREVAVRMAMGAKRGRLLRQLLTESVLVSLLGGLFGVLLAFWGVRGLVASLPANVPRADEIRIDAPVLLFTLGVSLLTGLVFGIAPAWKVASTNVHDPLKEGGRGTIGAGHHRLRNSLVVAEISLSLILLVGAGLLLRSFFRILEADAGFRADGVLTAAVPLPRMRYPDHPTRAAVVERILGDLESSPGVRAVAATVPLLGGSQMSFSLEGRPEPPPGQLPSADIARVTPEYFKAMGVRVLEGRTFDERDKADSALVCIVDETFVAKNWLGESPLGKRLKFGPLGGSGQWMEVVGVVAHVKNYGVDEDSRVEVYLPFLQSSVGIFTLVVHTDGDPTSLAGGLRLAVKTAELDLPVFAVRTLDDIVSGRTAERRLAVILISVFAGIALLLAAVGIYGVMSCAVTQRTQEIGIRMALGAEQEHILKMVLQHGTRLSALGVAIGLTAAFGLARLITNMLFQTSAADPSTFSLVPVLLLLVALLACYLPARRATRVDPMVALRNE
jgi:putative ABC transport system permease protein